jgi:hypothetical protein
MEQEILKQIEEVVDAPSCYPEAERKSREQRLQENIEWHEKYNEVNTSYNTYGMDRADAPSIHEWLDRGVFRKQRHDINSVYYPDGSAFPYNYTLFMRDKLSFELLMRSFYGNEDVYCRSYGVFADGKLYRTTEAGGRKEISAKELLSDFADSRIVFKNTFGCGGADVIVADIRGEHICHDGKETPFEVFLSSIRRPNSIWLIQNYIKQHPFMMSLNESSVNTIRVITFNTGSRIETAKVVMRIGKPGNLVDNSGSGGYYTGVTDEGIIHDHMFNYFEKMRYDNPHKGEKVPFFKEALELAVATHKLIPQLFTIGWDMVITPDGPMILEGNDGWDPNMSQTPPGYALRKTWDRLAEERQKNLLH